MDLKELLRRYKEGNTMTREEEKELYEWAEAYIDSDTATRLTILEQVSVTHDDVEDIYWDLMLSYDNGPVPIRQPQPTQYHFENFVRQWGWVFTLIAGLMCVMVIFLDKCNS